MWDATSGRELRFAEPVRLAAIARSVPRLRGSLGHPDFWRAAIVRHAPAPVNSAGNFPSHGRHNCRSPEMTRCGHVLFGDHPKCGRFAAGSGLPMRRIPPRSRLSRIRLAIRGNWISRWNHTSRGRSGFPERLKDNLPKSRPTKSTTLPDRSRCVRIRTWGLAQIPQTSWAWQVAVRVHSLCDFWHDCCLSELSAVIIRKAVPLGSAQGNQKKSQKIRHGPKTNNLQFATRDAICDAWKCGKCCIIIHS